VKNSNTDPTRNTIGLDLSDRTSTYCEITPKGQRDRMGQLSSTPSAFLKHFGSIPPALVALETGTHSRWASQVIRSCGHEVLVGNARELKPIFQSMKKTDRSDAEKLARLARADRQLLHPIELRNDEAQIDLTTLRARASLIEARTKLVLVVRGLVKPTGKRIPSCSAPSFHYRAAEAMPEELAPALNPILETISTLTAKINDYDRQVEAISEQRYPETKILKQVPGVGPITALAFILTIGDPHRFARSRNVGAYFGLTPRKDDSGDSEPQLRITKAGDTCVRTLLVSAAHYVLGPFGPDSDLKRFGEALYRRGGKNAKKRAVVAVARKLAVILHRLWITGEAYRPLRIQKGSPAKTGGNAGGPHA